AHQPTRLKSAHRRSGPRTGEVVERRKRGPVRQPRRSLHNIGQPTRTPVRNGPQPTRHPPELGRDSRLIVWRDQTSALGWTLTWTWTFAHSADGRGAGGACGVSARLLIRPIAF